MATIGFPNDIPPSSDTQTAIFPSWMNATYMEDPPIAMCGWIAFVANVIDLAKVSLDSLVAVWVCLGICPKHAVGTANKKRGNSDRIAMFAPVFCFNRMSNNSDLQISSRSSFLTFPPRRKCTIGFGTADCECRIESYFHSPFLCVEPIPMSFLQFQPVEYRY